MEYRCGVGPETPQQDPPTILLAILRHSAGTPSPCLHPATKTPPTPGIPPAIWTSQLEYSTHDQSFGCQRILGPVPVTY
uniref:Uncharacterized protein n=1 Tax=Bursaphelenchus xylophilus TaxID=6326 RepID=A0A1I7SUS8_BURXY